MSFREVKAEELTMNPFTKIGKEWLLITAGNEEKCNTMTASWGAMGVMWGKNAVTCISVLRDTPRNLWTGKIHLQFLFWEKNIARH